MHGVGLGMPCQRHCFLPHSLTQNLVVLNACRRRVGCSRIRLVTGGGFKGRLCGSAYRGDGLETGAGVESLVELVVVNNNDVEQAYRAIDGWLEDHEVTLRGLQYIEDCVVACEDDEERRVALNWIGERLAASLLGLPSHGVGEVQQRGDEGDVFVDNVNIGGNDCSSVAEGVASELQLSMQGMQLLQQQAVALEATIGIRKAESIVQILGRKRMSDGMKKVAIPEKGDAWRILEVLVQVQDRVERRDMLHEAFVPIDETEDEEYGEEEALSTTPFTLLQIVQTCLASQEELDTLCCGISGRHDGVVQALEEMREDIIESIDGNASC